MVFDHRPQQSTKAPNPINPFSAMIDGVKFWFYKKGFDKHLISLGISVKSNFDNLTGVELDKKFAEWKGLFIEYYAKSGRVEIKGSLHVWYYGNNYTDLTFADVCKLVKELCKTLEISPFEARVSNLEFGVNVITPFEPFAFSNALIGYNNDPFQPYREKSTSKWLGFFCENQQYEIKCYDKGKQYNLNQPLLRFEVKATRMVWIKEAGIKTLADLCNLNKLKFLANRLQNTFKGIATDDKVKLSLLTHSQQRNYAQFLNTKNWASLTRKKRNKMKAIFNNVVQKYGLYRWKEKAFELISSKLSLLLFNDPKKGYDLTSLFLTKGVRFNSLDKGLKRTLRDKPIVYVIPQPVHSLIPKSI